MENANAVWQQVKVKLKEKLDESTFNSTFGDINEVYKFYNNYIYLVVSDLLSKYRIEKFYLNEMNGILSE